ncbi:glucose-fructose oxidoreductase domain-containing protein 1-like [Paramacrobiotus metropolitanus]|uniref:glucose-fructose oxidoreductase domain-containing protein 1-like n=1 Tax=Paramacrobiotus metropolitanus TaxID=2943436 RepID=UPI0024458B7A|nr:glucose-fructose oxidoreductase domain-containing protein 1-like [Paramacrobiotus metropolitanus]
MLPKVGIFGSSTLAAAIIRELQRLSFELVGLWDQHMKTAVAWCQHFQIPFPTDSVEVLLQNQEVDLVFIFAPAYFHKEIATKALAAGKHVICEPPLGITCADNAAIMQQALYYPTLLTISTFGLRHTPGFSKLRSILESGQIGAVQSVEVTVNCGPSAPVGQLPYDWTCIGRLLGGPLFTLVCHIVDLITFLSGKRAYSVCGTVRRFQRSPAHFQYDQHMTREDFVSWQMLLEGNIPCTCLVNSNQPGSFNFRLTISGREGLVMVDDGVIHVQKSPEFCRERIGTVLDDRDPAVLPDKSELAVGFDYRHPEWVVSGVVDLCSMLKTAFQQAAERRCFSPDELQAAGGFVDCQYARSVCDAIRSSHENRRWMEVSIPLRNNNTASTAQTVLLSLKRFHIANSAST